MKKRDILNLIKYHIENDDYSFREQAYNIASDFNGSGDEELGLYVMSLLSDKNTFVPQTMNGQSNYIKLLDTGNSHIELPDAIMDDIKGIMNAISYNAGINKFLFEGAPGTGKTECAKHIARILNRQLYSVDFDGLIDSKLGQTAKNIASLFEEINNLNYPEQVIILFDEIDSLAMDRIDSRDLREMGRATSAVLKGFDNLNGDVVIIATTNLFDKFDKALIRRFDKVVDFGRYSREDLLGIAECITDDLLKRFTFAGRNMRLLKKLISLMEPIPYPGDLTNLIKTSLAFSDCNYEFDYFSCMLKQIRPELLSKPKDLKDFGFTLREIESLTRIPRSTLSRDFQVLKNE